MNLVEVTKLLEAIPQDDVEMIDFYHDRRNELVREINKDLAVLGMQELSLKELLLISPEPKLAATVI